VLDAVRKHLADASAPITPHGVAQALRSLAGVGALNPADSVVLGYYEALRHEAMIEAVDASGSETFFIAESFPIRDHATVTQLLTSLPDSDDTRSEWRWFRLANGDLVAGFYPQGEMVFATEVERDEDWHAAREDGSHRTITADREDVGL
jgi:hypothetical protein